MGISLKSCVHSRYYWKFLSVVLVCLGCSTGQPQISSAPLAPAPQAKLDEDRWLRDIATRIRVVKFSDPKLYLEDIVKTLSTGGSGERANSTRVDLIRDVEGLWRSIGLPGTSGKMEQIHLSLNVLKNIEYENELAGLIAIEIFHARRKTWILRAQQAQSLKLMQDWKKIMFMRQHLTNSEGERDREAFRSAVHNLYQLGYDPRGLVSLIQIFKKNPDSSPFEGVFLDELSNDVRREIAIFPPLRNPIIRSNRFLIFQKRVRQL
jgi:hypothetical protein